MSLMQYKEKHPSHWYLLETRFSAKESFLSLKSFNLQIFVVLSSRHCPNTGMQPGKTQQKV